MKQHARLQLNQKLSLSPQLLQGVRILQLSMIELGQELAQQMQDNPLLEFKSEDGSCQLDPFDDMLKNGNAVTVNPVEIHKPPEKQNFDSGNTWSSTPNTYEQHTDYPNQDQAAHNTLVDYLIWQVADMALSEREKLSLLTYIYTLNEDGYLPENHSEVNKVFMEVEPQFDEDEWRVALIRLRALDPPGIGAASLSECLALQLQRMSATSIRDLALCLVEYHLPLLARFNQQKIQMITHASAHDIDQARRLIQSLNPRPGTAYSHVHVLTISPDARFFKDESGWQVRINDQYARNLYINMDYVAILKKNRGKHGNLKEKLAEAKLLLKNVEHRFDSLLLVCDSILQRQVHFLEEGDQHLIPLSYRDVSQDTGLHESTISRLVSHKYVHTPRGIYSLKKFFSVGVGDNADFAASAVRSMVNKLINQEDKRKPLSDIQLVDLLAKQGVNIARRTVAKYRHALNIKTAGQRKEKSA